MTCKDCLHSRVCFDSEGTTRYYGTDCAAANVEDLCPCFADRSRYVVREKGEWKYYRKQGIAVCSSCSFERKVDDNFGRAVACPNCGADMRKGENDG